LEHADEAELTIASRGLGTASYVSVRDRRTQELLRDRCGIDAEYAPDIAVMLSRLFSRAALRELATPSVVAELERMDYWCLQVNPTVGASSVRRIAKGADRVSKKTGLRALLTPIGRCTRWEDRTVLTSIRKAMWRDAAILGEESTVFDIALALSLCACFVGTSLHGIVTAVSYGVPFVAMESDDPKVANNLASWGALDQFPVSPIADIPGEVLARIEAGPAVRRLSEELQGQALANVRRLTDAVSMAVKDRSRHDE
jgi:polysaccharide pyruvyl transferase WcaK-like protein